MNVLVSIASVLIIILCFMQLAGCNTIAGIGSDMKALAEGTQRYLSNESDVNQSSRNFSRSNDYGD
jgi:predicted small secreted protein